MKIGKTEESFGATALEKKRRRKNKSKGIHKHGCLKTWFTIKRMSKEGFIWGEAYIKLFFKDTHSSCMKNLKTKSRKKGLVFNYIQPDSLPHNKNIYKITGKS